MPRAAYIVGFIAATVIFVTIAYTYHIGMDLSTKSIPLLEASEKIESELSTAHLRFKETAGTDASFDEVLRHINRAERTADSILNGGETGFGQLTPVDDEGIHADVNRLRLEIAKFRAITEERWNAFGTESPGSDVVAQYDVAFSETMKAAEKVEVHLKDLIAVWTWQFRQVVFVLFGVTAIISVYGVFYLRRIFVGIVRDFSKRKKMEKEIENLATFPEMNPMPIIEVDRKCQITYANKAALSEFPGLMGSECTHPLLAEFNALVSKLLDEKKNLIMHTATVGEKIYEMHVSNVAGLGKVRMYITDITERRNAEERLRLSAKFFEETTEAVVVTDLNGDIQDVNAAFEDMTGYKREEVLGKNPRIMKSGRHDHEFYEEMWKSILETGNWHGEIWDRRKNGEVYPKWLSISMVRDDEGNPTHYVGISADISRLKRTQEQLHYLAHYDQLTGLPNRLLAHERLEQAITLAKRHGHMLAVLILDLDEFKRINDSLGHLAGDQLLNEVGRRIKDSIRESDDVARLGGDEFTVLLRNIRNPANAAHIAQNLITSIAEPYTLGDHEVFVSSSIGITLCPDDGEDMFTLMKNADAAMYHAKHSGKNNYQFFTEELNARIMERLVLEMRLRRAVENRDLTLQYQPRVDIASGEMVGMEALLRWSHEESGDIPPSSFISIAEDTGLILSLGEWVLREACGHAVMWNLEHGRQLRVSVNLSGRQFMKKGLVKDIEKILKETGLPPSLLELEITESVIMNDVEKSIRIMNDLREMGVRLSLDDFGTGYSSLSYLNRFPVNSLKIDSSFITDVTSNIENRAVVKAILVLAKSLGLKSIAEGVESREQLDFLAGEGCIEIQGHFYSNAVTAEVFEALIRDRVRL